MEALLYQLRSGTARMDQLSIWTPCLQHFSKRERQMYRKEPTKAQLLPEPLSERELEILQLLARGTSN